MADNWSTGQLKEFFEERAKEVNRRLGEVEKSVATIGKAVDGMSVRVNAMWAIMAVIGIAVGGAIFKLIGLSS